MSSHARLGSFSIVALLVAVTSCSASIEPGSSAATLTFSVTDSGADQFTSFFLDLTSIQARSADGAVTTIFSGVQRIDLASLRDASQVLNLVSLPPAQYDQVAVTIDFSHAECILVGQSFPALILDGDGNPRSRSERYEVEVFDPIQGVIGENRSVELDFGSARAMEVDAAANEVRFEPVPAVRVDRLDSKPLVMDGRLATVDEIGGFFETELTTSAGATVSFVTITGTSETVFLIDEVLSAGLDGLMALASVSAGTPVRVHGQVDFFSSRMLASHIEVGTSTPVGGLDIMEGQVVGRIGGAGEDVTLTVIGKGSTADSADTLVNSTFTVLASFPDTKVLQEGAAEYANTNALNIGQTVRVFGSLAGTMMDATRATDIVKILPTRIVGFAVNPPAGETLTMDLERVAATSEEEFNWSEGGATPPDPDALTVKVNPLSFFLEIIAGGRVEAFGAFRPVDDAEQDFEAEQLFNRNNSYLVVVRDRNGGLKLTPTIEVGQLPTTPASITLLLERTPTAEEVARVDLGFAGSQDLPPDAPLVIAVLPVPLDQIGVIPDEEEVRIFSICRRFDGACFVFRQFKITNQFEDEFNQFQAFADRLNTELGRGAVIYDIQVVGNYVALENRIDAQLVSVVLD